MASVALMARELACGNSNVDGGAEEVGNAMIGADFSMRAHVR